MRRTRRGGEEQAVWRPKKGAYVKTGLAGGAWGVLGWGDGAGGGEKERLVGEGLEKSVPPEEEALAAYSRRGFGGGAYVVGHGGSEGCAVELKNREREVQFLLQEGYPKYLQAGWMMHPRLVIAWVRLDVSRLSQLFLFPRLNPLLFFLLRYHADDSAPRLRSYLVHVLK